MTTKLVSEYFDIGAVGLPTVDRPINEAPASGVTVGSQKPVLTSSGYSSLYGKPQLAAEFILYNFDGTVILHQSGVLTPPADTTINSWQVPSDLALNTNYMWSHKFRSEFGEDYIESSKTPFFVPTSTVGVPIVLTPVEGSTPDNLGFRVNISPFVTLGVAQTHIETTVETATTSDFLTNLQTDVKTSGDLTFVDIDLDLASTKYFMRVKYKGSSTGYSSVSITNTLNTIDNSIKAPTITSPTNYEIDVQEYVNFESTPLQIVGVAQTQDAVEWEIYNDELLTSLFSSSGITSDPQLFNNYIVSNLQPSRTYFIRKRDSGNLTGFSDWSVTSRFSTADTFADWLAWDSTNDGFINVVESALTSSSPSRNSTISVDIGFNKALTIVKNRTLAVTQVSGLVVSEGPALDQSSSNFNFHEGLTRLTDDLALHTGKSSNTTGSLYYSVVSVSGNVIDLGPIANIPSLTQVYADQFSIVGISATKAVVIYSKSNNSSIHGRVLTISGNTVTSGAEFNTGQNKLGVGCIADSLGEKVAFTSIYNSSQSVLTILDVNTVSNTLSTATSETIPTYFVPISIGVKWLSEGWLAVHYNIANTNNNVSSNHIAVVSYDGNSTLTVNTNTSYYTHGHSTTDLATFEVIDENNLITSIRSTVDSSVVVHAIKVLNGAAFIGQPIQIISGATITTQTASYGGLLSITPSKVLHTINLTTPEPGTRQVILNGLDQ